VSAPLLHIFGEHAEMDREAIGRKAASLDRMSRSGLPTPPGFCLTVHAHALYMSENYLRSSIEELQRRLPEEAARVELGQLMFASPIPVELRACLERGLRALSERCDSVAPLAVRSSATREDDAVASFAGQHETVLGVSPENLESAVRRCWASLWSRRSVAYRRERSIPFDGDLMGILVQPLLAADASAVVFTSNPMTADEDEIVVSAVRGLGEPLVSGSADACTVTVDRPTLAVLSVEGIAGVAAGDEIRGVAIGGLATGHPASGELIAGGPAIGGSADAGLAIDHAAIERLVELCLRVERDMGIPVDVEAALVGQQWWLLQARPITTTVDA
jgi:pyruvate,water dikinase